MLCILFSFCRVFSIFKCSGLIWVLKMKSYQPEASKYASVNVLFTIAIINTHSSQKDAGLYIHLSLNIGRVLTEISFHFKVNCETYEREGFSISLLHSESRSCIITYLHECFSIHATYFSLCFHKHCAYFPVFWFFLQYIEWSPIITRYLKVYLQNAVTMIYILKTSVEIIVNVIYKLIIS